MRKSKTILLLLFGVTLVYHWSCTHELDVHIPDFKSQLVVTSFFKPGENFIVKLEYTQDILTNNISTNPFIENGFVRITDASGKESILTHLSNGVYSSTDMIASYNQTYEVYAEAEGFSPVTASSSIPVQVFVNTTPELVIEGDEIFNKITLSITDETKMQRVIWEIFDEGDENSFYNTFSFESIKNNPIRLETDGVEAAIIDNPLLQSRVFIEPTNTFQEQGYTTAFLISPRTGAVITDENGEQVEEKQKILRVMTVSPEFYDYLKSIEIFRLQNNANSIISEPFNIYSNVKGGLGIVAGYSEELFELN